MRRRLLAAAFLLTSVSATPAQKFDTTYVKSYKDKFFIWPVAKDRSLSFRLEDPNTVGRKVEFKPNTATGLGLGVYLFDIGFEFVIPVPRPKDEEDLYGHTRATDLQLNIISRRWGGDVVYQRYKGFYLSNPQPNPAPGYPYPQRPDIVTENLGVNGVYVLNNTQRFSLRSSFTFADRQLRSSGAWLLSGSFNLFEIDGDSAIVNPFYQVILGQTRSFTSLDYRTYAIAPGYAHNFMIRKNFFFSLLVAIGPAVNDFRYIDTNGVWHTDTHVNSYIDGRAALGYANDKFFAGLTISSQTRNVIFDQVRFGSVTTTGRILFGWRFTEWGFLKKSVWDLLPPWKRRVNENSRHSFLHFAFLVLLFCGFS